MNMKTKYKPVIKTMCKLLLLILLSIRRKKKERTKKMFLGENSPKVTTGFSVCNAIRTWDTRETAQICMQPSPYLLALPWAPIVWYWLGRLDRYHGDLDKPQLYPARQVRPCIWTHLHTHAHTHQERERERPTQVVTHPCLVPIFYIRV